MPIKIILTLGFLCVFLYAVSQRLVSRMISVLFFLIVAVGIYFVWVPDHTTVVAGWVGVGRGADLILYGWILITLIVGFNLHLKIRESRRALTELARQVALGSARPGKAEKTEKKTSPQTDMNPGEDATDP
jgi:hypothetical protein